MSQMHPDDPFSQHEADLSDNSSILQMIAMADAGDKLVELVGYYKKQLVAAGFSEQAAEMMSLQYHQKLIF